MLIFYRFLTFIVLMFIPIVLIYRILIKKEDINRFKEKFSIPSKKRKKGKLIWFHGASVGEILSIVPIVKKLEKKKTFSQILVTSSTLSSANVISNMKFKKVTHQFYPLDINFLVNIFLNNWKPDAVGFIDSEIWPNMIESLKKRKIKIFLINARLTKNSFQKWLLIENFAKKIFSNFSFALTSNNETKNFLKRFGVKNVFSFGNLKFTQIESDVIRQNNRIKKFFKKKKIWCALSTHDKENNFCIKTHFEIKKKHKNVLTILIPRHIEKKDEIIRIVKKNNLSLHLHSKKHNINKKTDIYIVDTYGETKKFLKDSKIVFLGGSLINHGGHNPLEAVRFGCKVIHGPNVFNFTEIYKFLSNLNMTKKINNSKELKSNITNYLDKNISSIKNISKIKKIGNKILTLYLKKIEIGL